MCLLCILLHEETFSLTSFDRDSRSGFLFLPQLFRFIYGFCGNFFSFHFYYFFLPDLFQNTTALCPS